jgi:hypothetical protein
MALRPDPLDQPLGRPLPDEPSATGADRGRTQAPHVWLAAGALAMIGFVALVVAADPKAPGGRPIAVARIETVAPTPPAPAPKQAAAAVEAPSRPQGAADFETMSGVRVHRPPGTGAPNALIIEVPQTQAPQLALSPAPDPRLTEKGPYGPIPKIGSDGSKPYDVYARPLLTSAALKPGAPRVALYVGGLGLAAGPTREAIALPPAVTLAFAPYGSSLARDVAAAREAGHEVLLQAPMEPKDYPANDPGQNTLLASDPAKNVDRLHWLMARFPGYVGVANFLGGKFLADEAAAAPVLKEIGARGLLFVEDLPADRSAVTPALANANGVMALRVDVVIDRADRPEAIAASFAELEKIARERGFAIGAASALPRALDATRKWANGLDAKGVALVPISAMTAAPPPPRAAAPKH